MGLSPLPSTIAWSGSDSTAAPDDPPEVPPDVTPVALLQRKDNEPGDAYHIMDGSTICLDSGYHPCAVLPGYEMYYFTILGGLSQRSLVQYFQPTHAAQIETIPGIKDMIAKFK